MTETIPPTPDELRRRRVENQRLQRVLQVEEQIADAKVRVEQAQNRLDGATERLATLEAELAELQAKAPPPEDAP